MGIGWVRRRALRRATMLGMVLAMLGSAGPAGTARAFVDIPTSLGGSFGFMCLRLSSGSAWCWGPNTTGNLGDRTYDDRNTPVQVLRNPPALPAPGYLVGVESVSGGGGHACAMTNVGNVWCWGANGARQLGDATTTDRPGAVIVKKDGGLLQNVVGIDAGGSHTCARLDSGSAWCWGSGVEGQLASGGNPSASDPVRMRRASGFFGTVEQVVTGGAHSCVRLEDGTAWCAGDNDFGQLGDGTRTDRKKAVQVIKRNGEPLTNVTDLDAGPRRTCAVTNDGSAWCWGWNDYSGAVGDGTAVITRTAAAKVKKEGGGALTGAVQISTGLEDTCALAGGQIWCWGHNYRGAAGNGTLVPHFTAVMVKKENGDPFGPGTDISVGRYFACALDSANKAWCWGSSKFGTIGNGGATKNPENPVEVTRSWLQ